MPAPKSLLKGFARTVATARPDPNKRLTLFDPDTRGLCVRITPKGQKTFTIVARNPQGKQVWAALPDGDAEHMDLEAAREMAREGVRRIKAGLEAFPKPEPEVAPPAPESFEAIFENYLRRYVKAQGLRSADEIERAFRVCIVPAMEGRDFTDIRRSDVAQLLDDIEDNRGPVMADRCLAYMSRMFNWYASRADDYSSPIVRGMARTKPRERARDRILSADEIRTIWPVLSDFGMYGALLKMALLTGQRREKVATMKWSDIDLETGLWTIPTEKGEKNNPGSLSLPAYTLDIIRAQKKIAGNPYVFAGRGEAHIAGWSPYKRRLDAKIKEAHEGEDIEGWTVHDLRRTAKSLMARAGVRPDVSERVLGHVIAGVEGTYDRHDYADEKADALAKLAGLVNRIINPVDNVVPIAAEA